MAYYVIGEGNNFYEGMTKEQILAAITQAIETHTITDVDTGFVTTIKEKNKNSPLALWVGTEAEYNAIQEKDQNTLYIKTDDSTLEAIGEQFAEYNQRLGALYDAIDNFVYKVGDVDNITFYGAGYLTSDYKKIFFSVPLPKHLPSGLKINLTISLPYTDLPFVVTVRQNGYYLIGSSGEEGSFEKSKIIVSVVNDILNIILNNDTAFANSTNNDTVGIYAQFVFMIEQA